MKYLPRHDSQYDPREPDSSLNCNMAAVADVARFYSLGLKDHNHHWYRNRAENPDGSRDNTGGTTISQAAEVLDDVGISSVYRELDDGATWLEAERRINGIGIVIAHGDYGSVPTNLRGPIDRTFTGLHSVTVHRFATVGGTRMAVIGDGLADKWTYWPVNVLYSYMRDFPGGFTFLGVKPRLLTAQGDFANVRLTPSRELEPLDRITRKDRLHVGGIVRGEAWKDNRSWYRVWHKGRIAYVHSIPGKIVGT